MTSYVSDVVGRGRGAGAPRAPTPAGRGPNRRGAREGASRSRKAGVMMLATILLPLFTDIVSAFSSHHGSLTNLPTLTRTLPLLRSARDVAFHGSSAPKCFLKSSGDDDDTSVAETSNAHDVSSSHAYFDSLLSQFQGDFDNYNQVVRDRRHGLTPGEGGGHEHIHCTIVPCPFHGKAIYGDDDMQTPRPQWVLAAFYFNGNPLQIFRFRVYQLIPPPSNESPVVRMKLHTLQSDLEKQLRRSSDQPCTWWKEIWYGWRERNNSGPERDRIAGTELDQWDEFQSVGVAAMVSPLKDCDVLWDPIFDASKHGYLYEDEYAGSTNHPPPSGQSHHATMEAGTKGAIVDSISMIPGQRILIKDELSLWQDEFWINDRGYDPDATTEEGGSLPFIYGNQRGIPYKLQKVSNIQHVVQFAMTDEGVGESLVLDRTTADLDLEWTLGEGYRTPDLYKEKLKAVDKELG